MGPGVTSLKYHWSSHRHEGHAEDSRIQESINKTMRPLVSSDENTDNMKEDQNDIYCIAGKYITPARAKYTEEIMDSEDFSLNTDWKNMQLNKYLRVNRKDLVKKYIEMPAGTAEEVNMEGRSHNYANTNVSMNLKEAPRRKNMQLNKYLRVNRRNLAKKYIKLPAGTAEEENMEGRSHNYAITNESTNLKEARLKSQCSFESRCESLWRIQEFMTSFSSVASECVSLHKH